LFADRIVDLAELFISLRDRFDFVPRDEASDKER